MMRKISSLVLILVVALMSFAPVQAQEEELPSLGDVIMARASSDTPEFTVLLAALQAADPVYWERLSDPEMVASTFTTVFAPTDAAFLELLGGLGMEPADALANTDLLNEVLAYHIMPGIFTAENFAAKSDVYYGSMAKHDALLITVEGESVMINDATVIEADIPAFDGIIHVIDKVLLPANAMTVTEEEEVAEETIYDVLQSREDFSIFLAAMDMMGFQTDLQVTPYTLFLPTDDVFLAFLEAQGITQEDLFANTDTVTPILFYHFLAGWFNEADFAELGATTDGVSIYGTQQPGTFMTISVDEDGMVMIDPDTVNAMVTEVIKTSNGNIMVIDQILLPSGS